MKIKKITALVLTMAVGASIFAGCSKNYEAVLTIDGEGVTPGRYLMAQLEAYTKATKEVEEGTTDILKATIEEKPAQQWITDETIKILTANVFYDKEFAKRGLTLTEDEIAQIEASTSGIWSSIEKTYKDNGIGLESYTDMYKSIYKRDKVFFDIYGAGKEKAPTASENEKFIKENYSRIRGFQISKMDVEGKLVGEDAIKQLRDTASDAQKELDGGANFEDTRVKYMRIGGTIVGITTGFGSEEEYAIEQFVKKDVEQVPEALINDIFSAEIDGKYGVYEMEQYFLVYQKIANDSNKEELLSLQTGIVAEMKNDEFAKFVEEQAAAYETKLDQAAINYYSAAKIKF